MKEISFFLNKHKNIVYLFVLLIFLTIISFLKEYFLITEKESFLYFQIILGLYIFSNLIFNKEDTEKFLIKNMTQVIFISLLILIFSQSELGITNNELFIIIGGVFAFWYSYKKYESEKEIKMIDKFIIGKFTLENFKDIENIFPWLFAIKLYERGDISNDLFSIIDSENSEKLYNFLYENKPDIDISKIGKKSNKIGEKINKSAKNITNNIYYLNKYKLLRNKYIEKIKEFIENTNDDNFKFFLNIIVKSIENVNKKWY